ncbi:MAG: tetratricopeptide repeat protein [Bdellovibrionota bacterium]
MKNALIFIVALSSTLMGTASIAAESTPTEKGRAEVASGDLSAAIVTYAAVTSSQKAAPLAEYGWVLKKAGYNELALAQIDRALQIDKTDAEVLYYTSSVLASLGLPEAASEISRPAPDWIAKNEKLPSELTRRNLAKTFREDINIGTGFLMQRRYASAVDHYHQMTKKYPREHHAWAGYAISLESIGAYKAAARAVAKDIELSKNTDEKTRALQASYKQELEVRPAVETPQKTKANEMLKGRYLVFFGGSVNNTSTNTIINLNGRAGKFLTNQIDAAINAGLISGYSASDYNGVTLGVSARYLTPLPVEAPLSFAGGARVQYTPGPSDQTTIYISPGLSYFLPNGSLDLTLDFGLAGPLKDTKTISVGYTMYLGGAK